MINVLFLNKVRLFSPAFHHWSLTEIVTSQYPESWSLQLSVLVGLTCFCMATSNKQACTVAVVTICRYLCYLLCYECFRILIFLLPLIIQLCEGFVKWSLELIRTLNLEGPYSCYIGYSLISRPYSYSVSSGFSKEGKYVIFVCVKIRK